MTMVRQSQTLYCDVRYRLGDHCVNIKERHTKRSSPRWGGRIYDRS